MNINIPQLLARGEGISVEFKRAKAKLPKTLFETVCAFLNRNGGVILLGVDDDKTVEGVDHVAADRLIQELVSLSNNPQKLSPSFLLEATKVEYKGSLLIHVFVPASSQVIQSAIPHYKVDALLRRIDLDRYDDRENIRCNLIEAYDRLMAFITKHLPDKFYLEGDQRISLRDKIFREVVANMLLCKPLHKIEYVKS